MAWLKNPFKRKAPDPGLHAAHARTDPYSFQVSHKRLAWMLRVSTGTNIVLAACLIILISAYSHLLPLKTTEIALLRSDPEDNRLYRIEPISEDVEGFDLLLEDKARRFMRNLLEIDSVSQTERFREAFRMMDPAFFNRFKKERLDSNKVQDALDSGLTRSITVISVDRIAAYGGTYKFVIDFTQTDTRDGKLVEEKLARATMDMTTRPQEEIRKEDRFENPLGIVVLDLSLKERGNS